MPKHTRPLGLVAILLCLSLAALLARPPAQGELLRKPSPAEAVQTAWRNAQKAGRYQFHSEITQIIRSMLRATSDIEEETVSVDVKEGYVTLAGNVSDRKEMNRIEKVISNIKGIRDIHNLTTISPR